MMKMQGFYIDCMAIALIALGGCEKDAAEYRASGTFESEEIALSSEQAGTIVAQYVEEGQTVGVGTLAYVIDTTQLDLKRKMLYREREKAWAQRPDAKAQAAVIENQIETAMTEKARVQALVQAKAAPQKQLDDMNAQIELLQKQLYSLKSSLHKSHAQVNAQVEAIDLNIAQVEDLLTKSKILAPISGTVLSTYAQTGEYASPGKPLFSLANLQTLYLRAYISGSQLDELQLGQKVEVLTDNEKHRRYEGTITWISSKAEFTPKTVLTRDERSNLVYAVKVRVKNDGYLRIGMYGAIR